MIEEKTTVVVSPPERTGRYRQKMSSIEVIEQFIANTQPCAQSANLYLDRGELFSYGRHWPLARWVRNTTGGPEFCLFRYDKGSMTTSTKHRAPLVQALNRDGRLRFCVGDVTAETERQHRYNYELLLERAEALAKTCTTGPKDLRPSKAWAGIDLLFVAFHYMNYATVGGLPESDMPHTVLCDFIEERLPNFPRLLFACQMLRDTPNIQVKEYAK